jgi:hypothetical protein
MDYYVAKKWQSKQRVACEEIFSELSDTEARIYESCLIWVMSKFSKFLLFQLCYRVF